MQISLMHVNYLNRFTVNGRSYLRNVIKKKKTLRSFIPSLVPNTTMATDFLFGLYCKRKTVLMKLCRNEGDVLSILLLLYFFPQCTHPGNVLVEGFETWSHGFHIKLKQA